MVSMWCGPTCNFKGIVFEFDVVEGTPVNPDTVALSVGINGMRWNSTKDFEMKLPPDAPESTYAKALQDARCGREIVILMYIAYFPEGEAVDTEMQKAFLSQTGVLLHDVVNSPGLSGRRLGISKESTRVSNELGRMSK